MARVRVLVPLKAQRGFRAPDGSTAAGELLRCACWCEESMMWVAPDDLGVRTFSCGRPDCGPPTKENP